SVHAPGTRRRSSGSWRRRRVRRHAPNASAASSMPNAKATIASVTANAVSTWAPVREPAGVVGGCTWICDGDELGVSEAVVGVVVAAVVGVVVVGPAEPTDVVPPSPVTGSVRPGVGSKRY